MKVDWDQEITGKELQVWTNWKSELEELKKFTYTRGLKLFSDKQVNICQMHVFADATELVFAAVIYCIYDMFTCPQKFRVHSWLVNQESLLLNH